MSEERRKFPRPLCFTTKPLSKFVEGDVICFSKPSGTQGHKVRGHGTFVKLEKGLVHIKYVSGEWEPSWMDERSFAERNPGGIVKVRPSSCFLWGKEPGDPSHDHCLWFEGTTFGVTGRTE